MRVARKSRLPLSQGLGSGMKANHANPPHAQTPSSHTPVAVTQSLHSLQSV